MYKITAFSKDHTELTSFQLHTTSCLVARLEATKSVAVNGKRRMVAYLRVTEDGNPVEVYFTAYGRKAGVRSYQAFRPMDPTPHMPITGFPPVKTGPYLTITNRLVQGEGDPMGEVTHPEFSCVTWAWAVRTPGGYRIHSEAKGTRYVGMLGRKALETALKEISS